MSEDGSGGACAAAVGLHGPLSVTLSPDGRTVYVADLLSGAVAVFARSRTSGALTQLAGSEARVSNDGAGGECADGVAIARPTGVAVNRDGRSVYVTADDSNAVAVFGRRR